MTKAQLLAVGSTAELEGGSKPLPCPFCGATPHMYDLAGWEIHCGCGVVMVADSPALDSAVAAWNRRAPHGKPAAWMNAFGEPQKERDEDFRWPLYELPSNVVVTGSGATTVKK